MNFESYFPDGKSAAERTERVLKALREKDDDLIQLEIGKEVIFFGIATPEALWGIGCDFFCHDAYVRVHGIPSISPQVTTQTVSRHVCVLGKLINIHSANLVIVLSSKSGDYVITGTT